jgi:hypothetical protein
LKGGYLITRTAAGYDESGPGFQQEQSITICADIPDGNAEASTKATSPTRLRGNLVLNPDTFCKDSLAASQRTASADAAGSDGLEADRK